ncbi:MAG: LacI family transcription regulator [Conexibacter sp.]|nr:LacI family transcription regulator [Conexibacter sp.]
MTPRIDERPTPPAPDRRATIADVATLAGVSVATVSRVMRDIVGATPQTRVRVRAAIDELQYRPRAGARSMRGRTYTMGVVVSVLSNPWQATLVDYINERADDAGFQVLVGVGREDSATDDAIVAMMADHGMDGVLMLGPRLATKAIEDAGRRLPTVVFSHYETLATCDTVTVDNAFGTRLVMEHLTGLGHRSVAHIGPVEGSRTTTISAKQRAAAFVEEAQRLGVTPQLIRVEHPDAMEGGNVGFRTLLQGKRRPTALFAGSDAAALGAIAAAADAGLDVPGDISIVGWDNIPITGLPGVSLTTVDQDGRNLGHLLVDLLVERVEERRSATRSVRTAPRLVVRGSSAPPPR